MEKFLFIIIAYLIGSIPFSYLLGKFIKKDDIRKHGSGNLGATNAFRVFGVLIGVLVMILDTLKSGLFIPIVSNMEANGIDMFHPMIYGGVAVLGHIFPVWMKFKGGKGVASAFGILIFYYWPIPVVLLPIFIAVVAISKYVSLGSITVAIGAFISGLILLFVNHPIINGHSIDIEYVIIVGILMIIILIKHSSNIKRLLAGNENRVAFKKKV